MSYKSLYCTYCLCNIENNSNRVGNFCSEEHNRLFDQEHSQESGSLRNYFDESKTTWNKNKKGGVNPYYLEEI